MVLGSSTKLDPFSTSAIRDDSVESRGAILHLTGEVVVPEVAIVEFDGGRIRTRKEGCGPGVHLSAKGWNETKNAIFVSAASETSTCDPQPKPPACFLDASHVAITRSRNRCREEKVSGTNNRLCPPYQSWRKKFLRERSRGESLSMSMHDDPAFGNYDSNLIYCDRDRRLTTPPRGTQEINR